MNVYLVNAIDRFYVVNAESEDDAKDIVIKHKNMNYADENGKFYSCVRLDVEHLRSKYTVTEVETDHKTAGVIAWLKS